MPRCGRKVDDRWAICGECWRSLPEDHRSAISRAFTPGMTAETATPGLYRAIASAYGWIVATFGDAGRDKHDPNRWARLVEHVRERDAARRERKANR